MKRTFKGIVICSMLSSTLVFPVAAFASGADDAALCLKGLSRTELYDVNCENLVIPQESKKEIVPVYCEEEKKFEQPSIVTYEPKEIWTEVRHPQPDIVELIPRVVRTERRIPQPDMKVKVPVITYKIVSVPQPDKFAYDEHTIVEKKITKREDLVQMEKRVTFVPSETCQETKTVKLAHHKLETRITEQPDMVACTSEVAVKAPEITCAPTAPAQSSCESAAACKALIKNDTASEQTFSLSYYESFKKMSTKITLKAGEVKEIEMQETWHFKTIKLNGAKAKLAKNAHFDLSSLMKKKA